MYLPVSAHDSPVIADLPRPLHTLTTCVCVRACVCVCVCVFVAGAQIWDAGSESWAGRISTDLQSCVTSLSVALDGPAGLLVAVRRPGMRVVCGVMGARRPIS